MNRIMQTAASGMAAQQLNVDNISNNLANVNTPGYKKSRIEFQDLLYQSVRPAGSETDQGTKTPTELQIGCGTRPVATSKMFSQGDIIETGNPLDVAINGDGFFQVLMPDGTTAYTRDGSFKLSDDGRLVTSDGYEVTPEITLPLDTTSVNISRDGRVTAFVAGVENPEEIGQIELVKFINPAGMKNLGHNLYQATPSSGEPSFGQPGTEGFGTIEQFYLESSNVDVVEEMVNMIVAQRAYEINSKAIKTADEMMQLVNRLK
ncbi:flagellar basal body rod protein FlgG [candidate division KSB1 bacterium]|nr:MAG: flagellar basal body rod protein FlgG [candidate division KSB1 bacterium]